jgi:integrase
MGRDRRMKVANKRMLNERLLRTTKPGERTILIWDADTRGLVLEVRPSGRKSWRFIYSLRGRSRWYSIGDADARPLSDARKVARLLRTQVDDGNDPQAERKAQRNQGTFGEVSTRYVQEHSSKHNKSWKQADNLVSRYLLPRWSKLPVNAISPKDVKSLIGQIERPILATQVLASASAVFSWAQGQDLITQNPCAGVKRTKAKARERVLSDAELPLFWSSLAEHGVAGVALKLILLLGSRPGEVAGMRYEHISDGAWNMPGAADPQLGWKGTKGKLDHRVWLPDAVRALIGHGSEGFVLAQRGGKPINQAIIALAMKQICVRLGVKERVTPHDLRRTWATRAAEAGSSNDAIDRALGHRIRGVLRVYNRHQEDRRIWEVTGAHILDLVEVKGSKKIVAFPRA